jgi:signal transduction histidine kinase
MKTILEDFLSLGKMEEGLVAPNIELVTPEAIDTMLKDLLEELDGTMATEQDIRFINTINQDVWIDRNLIRNILVNLFSNAIKFTPATGQITVKSCVEHDQFVISVADNGIGISDEDQLHLFERFFRAKNAGHIQGTGLGLHIVAKYLELLDGSIRIESKLNAGTTVNIYVPQSNPRP